MNMSNLFDDIDDNGRHVPFEFSTEDDDMDSWDEGDDDPDSFGPLPGQTTPTSNERSRTDVKLIDDEETGSERRQFHRSVLYFEGPDAFMKVVDQVDVKEAEKLERLVVDEIQTIRKDFHLRELFISDLLRQASRAQSQYYTGNCTRNEDSMPFDAVSFVISRNGTQSLNEYACSLIEVLKDSEVMMTSLRNDKLFEIGVGVWGCSDKFAVTIAKF